jgi:hypothetical protein
MILSQTCIQEDHNVSCNDPRDFRGDRGCKGKPKSCVFEPEGHKKEEYFIFEKDERITFETCKDQDGTTVPPQKNWGNTTYDCVPRNTRDLLC